MWSENGGLKNEIVMLKVWAQTLDLLVCFWLVAGGSAGPENPIYRPGRSGYTGSVYPDLKGRYTRILRVGIPGS